MKTLVAHHDSCEQHTHNSEDNVQSVSDCSNPAKHVAIVYETIPHYRAPFYDRLHDRLASRGIQFTLYGGRPSAERALRRDVVDESWFHSRPWAVPIRQLRTGTRNRYVTWQLVPPKLLASDLVIVEQASRHALNYLAMAAAMATGRPKLAYWGHGTNSQQDSASLLGGIHKETNHNSRRLVVRIYSALKAARHFTRVSGGSHHRRE